MGILLAVAGSVWAAIGTAGIIYGILRVTPGFTSSLAELVSLYPGLEGVIDVTGTRFTINALMIFGGLQAFIIPGPIVAGLGTLIRLQRPAVP